MKNPFIRTMELSLKKISLLFLILTTCWMSIIFYFSSREGDESSQDSLSIGIWIGNAFIEDFDTWSCDEQYEFVERIDYPIRKCAHAMEYTCLGFLAYCILKEPNKKWFLLAWLLCALYAASDEFHQLFVVGRSGQISDVCLDSCGAFVGIFLANRLHKYWKRHFDVEVYK